MAGARWLMRYERRMACGVTRATIIFAAMAAAGTLGLGVPGAQAQAKAKKAKAVNLPYTTIDHPQFVPASQASFLGAKDIVLGVTDATPSRAKSARAGGPGFTAKAYPAAILAQHGVVQDSMANGPIAITW